MCTPWHQWVFALASFSSAELHKRLLSPFGAVYWCRWECGSSTQVWTKGNQTSVPRPPWRHGLGTNEPWSGSFVMRMWSDLTQTQLLEELPIFGINQLQNATRCLIFAFPSLFVFFQEFHYNFPPSKSSLENTKHLANECSQVTWVGSLHHEWFGQGTKTAKKKKGVCMLLLFSLPSKQSKHAKRVLSMLILSSFPLDISLFSTAATAVLHQTLIFHTKHRKTKATISNPIKSFFFPVSISIWV